MLKYCLYFDAAVDDTVSDFIVGTCRMLPKSNTVVSKLTYTPNSEESEQNFIVSGSCAEFFIQPLRPCFGDVDYLLVVYDSLVFTDDNLVLPYDLRHIAEPIQCLQMEPYLDYPAFVRLRILGEMRYDWEQKSFEFAEANVKEILDTSNTDDNDENDTYTNDENWLNHGPALSGSFLKIGYESIDVVPAAWCPQWPNQAKDWPFRLRTYGWPTPDIIHEVIQNGCHVVLAKHPDCRNDTQQWRLSFSIAEVILLQSWTHIQQIVYHMLRFFAQRELIRKDCPKEDEVLCTYHFKTLMLWSCEKKPSDWWNSSSVIELCCNLLKKLEKWLKAKRCRNYFIPEANLFHEHFNLEIVDETAKTLIYYSDSDNLSLWFMKHYMQPSFLDVKCTDDVLSREYLSKTLAVMKASYPTSIDLYFSTRFWYADVSTHDTM